MDTPAQNELQRLEAFAEYDLPGGTGDPALDELTALAAQICGTALAGIVFAGADALYFASRVGPGPSVLPCGRFPCETLLNRSEVYEVSDGRYHPDYRPDGVMISGRAYRFFASTSLRTPSGVAIGTLWVKDTAPRVLNAMQRGALETLSRQVMAHLELKRYHRLLDHTEKVHNRVETALSVERAFVSTVLDTVGALVAVFDTSGRVVRFNRTCEIVSGYDFDSLAGRPIWDKLIPAQDIPEAMERFDRLRQGRFPASFEMFWQHRDGSLRRIAWSATALLDPQGVPNYIIGTGIDVTLQREVEATLRESEARYRQLVEGALGMVYTHDLQGELLSLNAHGALSLGHDAEEMLGHSLARFMAPDRLPGFEQYLAEIDRTGEAQGRMYFLHPDEVERVIAFRNKLIELPGHEPYVLGFGIDITEQVHAEELLRALIHQSDSVLESVGDGIFGQDLEGRLTVINPAAAEMLGYRPDELLGRRMHELIHHSHADGSPYAWEDCPMNRANLNFDTLRVTSDVFWRKDGSPFPVDYVARPQIQTTGPDGGLQSIGVVVAFTDTTERRALDRMKDEFISTVSHELRTPLTSLRAALGLLGSGALDSKPDRRQQMMEIATGNSERLIRLVNDILDIERIASGSEEMHSEMCTARRLFEESTGLQEAAALKKGLRFVLEPDDVEVWADPDRTLQALANLISNAVKFSPQGGTVSLCARYVEGQQAEITVSDEGRGIPADKLQTIFERFQQVDASDSREMGGTGLGLAICRSIVTKQGGRIWATSPEKGGARLHFTLPTQPSGHLR